jgi:hypothetical protein
MDVQFWHCHDRVTAIEGCLQALAGAGVVGGNHVSVRSIEEGVQVDHVARHVVGPFEDLRADVDKKGILGPAS